MEKERLPSSIRKYIRKEKARIRREILDLKKQKEEIEKLYQRIFEKYKKKKTFPNKISLNFLQKEEIKTKEK